MKTRLTRGLVAGFIAAATFAVFFLLVDLLQGQPFRTPAYMSGLVFSFTTALPASARLATFTVIHFVAFGAVGMLVGWLLDKLAVPPRLYMGLAAGVLLFDVVFYGSVAGLGVDVVRELGWPAVLIGNLLAGTAMFAYLKARSGVRVFTVQDELRSHDTLRRGLIAGLLGAAIVAAWFFVIDLVQQRLFYTPAALGSALFFGASHPGDVAINTGVVLGYTLVHFAAFIIAGLGAAWLMEAADRHPPALIGVVLLFVTLEVLSLGILSAVAAWLFETVPWWSPVVANLLAAGVMASYLWAEHPVLQERLSDRGRGEVLSAR